MSGARRTKQAGHLNLIETTVLAVQNPCIEHLFEYARYMNSTTDPGQEILDRITAREVERARLEAEAAADMLQFQQLRKQQSQAARNAMIRDLEQSYAVDELASAMHTPVRTIQCRLAEFSRVREALPDTWAMFCTGRLDGYRISMVASALLAVPEDNYTLIHLDYEVVNYAPTRTASQLKAKLSRFVTAWGVTEKQIKNEHEQRRAVIEHGEHGMSWLHAYLPTAQAIALDHELTRRAKSLPADDARSFDQKRADELIAWLFDHTAGRPVNRRAIIGITIPATSLYGLTDEPGESFDGSFALPADTVRDLAAQPGTLFHRIITDPAGRMLDITELGYVPSPELRTAVEIRDGTCTVAHCSKPAMDCDIDHNIPHPRGPTTGWNLRGLCRRHHRQKTHLNHDPTDLHMHAV